ncbi:MAG: hypothetical protein JWQ44_1527 [Chthoniobacter sp.]|nr:hypothetical protein [Chthoniobacter sp.]
MAKGDSIWEAAEGSKHLTDLVEESIQLDGEAYETALQGGLEHVVEHLARAWHFRRLTRQEVSELDEDTFWRLSNSIPNLAMCWELVLPE